MAKVNDKPKKKKAIVPTQHVGMISNADVQSRIIYVRDSSVIVDADVAEIYGVETKRVNEAVRSANFSRWRFCDDHSLQTMVITTFTAFPASSDREENPKDRYMRCRYHRKSEFGRGRSLLQFF